MLSLALLFLCGCTTPEWGTILSWAGSASCQEESVEIWMRVDPGPLVFGGTLGRIELTFNDELEPEKALFTDSSVADYTGNVDIFAVRKDASDWEWGGAESPETCVSTCVGYESIRLNGTRQDEDVIQGTIQFEDENETCEFQVFPDSRVDFHQ